MEYIDHRLLPAFLAAQQNLNFTRAAEVLSTTQSNISQQIQKLERQLGAPLFVRVNKKVALTPAGKALLEYMDRTETALQELKANIGKEREVSGWVRYAMPHSCLFTPHFEELLRSQREFAKIRLDVKLIPNDLIVSEILEQKLDFGFITRRSDNSGVAHEAFAHEEYVMVAAKGYWDKKASLNLTEIDFVDYPGFAALYQIWRESIAPRQRKATYERLHIVGRITSLSGSVTMLLAGLGVSVMPRHVIEAELNKGLLEIHPLTKHKRASSDIWIAMLQDRRLPARVRTVVDAFRRMKKQSGAS